MELCDKEEEKINEYDFRIQSHIEKARRREGFVWCITFHDPPKSTGIKGKQEDSIRLLCLNTKHYLGIDFAYLSPRLLIGSSEASPLHLTLPCCLDSAELWGKQHVSPIQSVLLNHALSGNCPSPPPQRIPGADLEGRGFRVLESSVTSLLFYTFHRFVLAGRYPWE